MPELMDDRHLDIVAAETCVSRFSLHPETGPSKHDEPHGDVDRGRDHHAKDELFHCAPDGDLCNEHADKGAPCDPPAPVEESPVVHPGLRSRRRNFSVRQETAAFLCSGAGTELLERVGVRANLNQGRGVVAHRLDVEVQQVDSLVHQEDDSHQSTAAAEAELADPSDAVLHPGEDGDSGDNGDGPDDDDLGARALRDVWVHKMKTLVDLDGANTQTSADAPNRGQHRHNVNLKNWPC